MRVPAAAVLPALALTLAAPARADWAVVGPGDCAGPEAGASKGLSPARAKCNASTSGMAAVCYDGKAQVHPALKGAGCVYKKVAAGACRGGAHPGTVFRCDGYPPPPASPPKAPPASPPKPPPPAKTPPTATPAGPSDAPDAGEAPPEPAQSASRRKVQACLNKAADLFAARDFAGALAELRLAQQSQDLAVVRFNIARCLEELERSDEAVEAYRDYLASPDVAAGAEVRRGYATQTISLLSGQNEQPPQTPPSELLAWRYLRVDDCLGDEAGASDGATPAAPLCVPATAGNAAVCWDGVEHVHPSFKGATCVYKSVLASTCKGGRNPGALYECAGAGAPAPAAPRPAAEPSAAYSWQYVGPGDCAGGDVDKSKGTDPAPEKCDASRAGKLAVCWDGMTQRNPSVKGAACTYKGFGAKACKPGATPGLVFECVSESDSVSQLLGPAPAATTPPAAPPTAAATPPTTGTTASSAPAPPKPGRWTLAGAGDCVGAPLGVSKGLGPARAKCDSSHYGQVAVCWDGAKTKNPALKGPGCSYQATKAENCRGGPHPGTLFRCGP